MKPSSQGLTFVVTHVDTPRAAAADRESAQARALEDATGFSSSADWDYRWDEYLPGQVWRLMQRRKGPAGKGRRYSWTSYAVHAVDTVTGGAR